MKLYQRNFLLILFIAFGSIFGWLIFISNSSPAKNLSIIASSIHPIARKLIEDKTETLSNDLIVASPVKQPTVIDSKNVDPLAESRSISKPKRIRSITCKINGEYKINCLKLMSGKETSVYIPFSFIHKYFEIGGKIVNQKSQDEYFEWNHSYSKIFYPDQPYDPADIFLWFGNYNVEFRDRVKCISAIDNVPLSTQWYPAGHLYPTQICQYGLSHFNKNLTSAPSERIQLINDGIVSDFHVDHNFIVDFKKNYLIVKDSRIDLKNNHTNYLIGQLDMKLIGNASITFVMFNIQTQQISYVVYSTIDDVIVIDTEDNQITYGLGSKAFKRGWFHFTRDLLVDLYKGYFISDRKRNNYYVSYIQIDGTVYIKNLALKTSAHEEFAMAAGDWLMRNQNAQGGWRIQVDRKLSKGLLVIKKGWHSAMAQGHAISLLTRLYRATNNTKYLETAKKALNIFEIESYKNGVKAILFDKYIWYEEYPTVPSIFVLNGFIYSLFGLYDLSKACNDQICQKSSQFYDEGIRSLESALSLYDSGSGSFYDLRHLSLGIAPNLARWDYHSTHINQLLYLYTITRNDLFKTVADRWIAYMKGHRSSHN